MEHIDKRKHYVLVFDTETTNTIQEEKQLDMSNVLFYDCGWQVVDIHGTVYAQASYINRDIFCHERILMQSAYYASKIPRYIAEVQAGLRIMADQKDIRKAMIADMEKYGITEVVAHNARFDITALNGTQRYVTQSKWRYWFPYGTEVWDTMRMANDVICKMPTYIQFCKDNNFLTPTGKPRKTAEVLYRYITGDLTFKESHTGLEDVQIETAILAYCYRQHKPMPHKVLFAKPPQDTEEKNVFYVLGQNTNETVEEILKKVLDK